MGFFNGGIFGMKTLDPSGRSSFSLRNAKREVLLHEHSRCCHLLLHTISACDFDEVCYFIFGVLSFCRKAGLLHLFRAGITHVFSIFMIEESNWPRGHA